jgi:hypothetical protein
MLSGASRQSARVGLIFLMVACSLMMWVGNPVVWLWIGSHVTSSQQAGTGPYMLVGTGILVSTILVAFALARLYRTYERIVGRGQATVRVRLAWLRSLRDDRQGGGREVTVLDLILVTTAVLGVLSFVVWLLLFAGSSLPGA